MSAVVSSSGAVGTANTLDVARIREDFPALHQQVNGRPLIYLDNAATAQTPRAVIEAVTHFYAADCSNIHRGVHTLSARATAAYEGAREKVRAFIGAQKTEEIVFVRGTTEAINLVATSWGNDNVGAGDEIIVSEMEHHSNIVPWQMLCQRVGAQLRVIPVDDRGELVLAEFERQLSARTKLVAVAHVSNALGTINPVEKITALAHAQGVPVLLDGAQGVPHLPVDVDAIGCDFYAFSGHKLYGPMGIGALYGRAELLESMPPFEGGGGMIRSVSFEKTTFAGIPERFEAGTPNVVGAIGLGAAVDYMTGIGMAAVAAHGAQILDYAQDALATVPGLTVIGTGDDKTAVCSMVLEGVHPHDLGTILDQQGVAIRAGHHCAQPLMERFGVPATARASFGIYNSRADVDALVTALHEAREIFGLSDSGSSGR